MSDFDGYVIVASRPDRGEAIHFGMFTSEGEARAKIAEHVKNHPWVLADEHRTYTVHKLGPAIEPPEPREWVVVWGPSRTVNDHLLTLEEARDERDRLERRWNPSIMRVVPEDPA